MYGVVFQRPRPALGLKMWVATVHGYAAEGRTKRTAERKLKQAVPGALHPITRWASEPFLSGRVR